MNVLKHDHKSHTLDYSSDLPHDMNNVIALTYLYTCCHLVFLYYLGCWITLVAYASHHESNSTTVVALEGLLKT
jgi:hypothetical protein